ncbi:hypothetical protein CNMCM7691_006611 [Aspergillus felis]|uniref:NRPS-like enzyme n=1 Tax=Aspergillus felis TaxID=1287682 RepID=A0A8H6R575_9EURO|nr:hypothetical protein CNMCM7691_006611 [Aspergillus felis]
MGYARAKWVCERILHEVAQTQGDLLHPIIVRLAILKTSQLLGALPELDGSFWWIPIDIAAKSIIEILFSHANSPVKDIVYHIENPIRQAWKPLLPVLARELRLKTPLPIPFRTWLERASSLSSAEADMGYIHHLLPFLQEKFQFLSIGGVIVQEADFVASNFLLVFLH